MKFDALSASATKGAFLSAYLLLVISTVYAAASNPTLAAYLLAIRSGLYVLIMLAWLLRIVPAPRKYLGVIVLFACILPYLMTSAYMFVVDTCVIVAVASTLGGRDNNSGRFFGRVAYISAAFVVLVAVLSVIGIAPSAEFEWGGRIKNSAGFSNPNTYYYYLFTAAFIFFVLGDIIGFVIIGLIMAAFYVLVESRTFFFAYMLMVLYLLLGRLLSAALRNAILWVCLFAVTAFGAIMAIFPLEVAAGLSYLFDLDASELLSNRLDIISEGGGVGATQVGLLGGKANYADSLYVYFIDDVGPVFSLLAAGVLFHLIWRKSQPTSQSKILVVSVIYMMIGCFEVPYSASSLIAAFYVWYVFFDAGRSGERTARILENTGEVSPDLIRADTGAIHPRL